MLSLEDMAVLTAAVEKRLGVNSPEFMERHNEIMKMADEIQSRYKKNSPQQNGRSDRGNTAGAMKNTHIHHSINPGRKVEGIMMNFKKVSAQFGVELTEDFVKVPEYEQLTIAMVEK